MGQPTYPLVDVVATIFACLEYQTSAVATYNPAFNVTGKKPSEGFFVPATPAVDGSVLRDDGKSFPSVTEYTKATLGMDTRWLHKDAIAVAVDSKHQQSAEDAIAIIQNKFMLMVLKGSKLNGFHKALAEKLESIEVQGRDIGLLTFVPQTAAGYAENDKIDEKKTEYMDSRPLGNIDDKVEVDVTVFNIRPMGGDNDSILYESHDAAGNLITFFRNVAAKGSIELDGTYSIKAKIKKVGPTPYSFGAIVNTLYYVRMPK